MSTTSVSCQGGFLTSEQLRCCEDASYDIFSILLRRLACTPTWLATKYLAALIEIVSVGADDEHSQMASVEIPDLKDYARDSEGAYELHLALREAFDIEIQTSFWQGRLWVRVCAQIFNVINDYVALRDAISKLQA